MRGRFPGIVRIGIAFPFDQIFESVLGTAGIEDVVDFEMFVIVFDVGGGRRGGKSVGRKCGFDGVKE